MRNVSGNVRSSFYYIKMSGDNMRNGFGKVKNTFGNMCSTF